MIDIRDLGPLPEVCPKCRYPMLDGAEHHTCQPTRGELEAQITDLQSRLTQASSAAAAGAKALAEEVERRRSAEALMDDTDDGNGGLENLDGRFVERRQSHRSRWPEST